MMEIIKGNILKAKEDIIVQLVGCNGTIKSDLGEEIIKKWPIVFKKYKKICDDYSSVLLGEIQCVTIENPDDNVDGKRVIVNIFGIGEKGLVDYEAVESAVLKLKQYAAEKRLSIAVPYWMGSDLGRGDHKKISLIIGKHLFGLNYMVYV